jgi:hypothetical protein
MRAAICFAVFFILSMSASAVTPLDPVGRILNVPEGVYHGGGDLKTEFGITLNFNSTRTIRNGTIEATSKAFLVGLKMKTAIAKLKVIALDATHFDLLDLTAPLDDGSFEKVGEGTCGKLSCTFTAVVMDGKMTLKETWIANDEGFDIVNCSQIYNGSEATYDGKFIPVAN